MASTSASTCLCCDRSFPDHVSQRAHYQSEWHRYNLKRKVAQLKSVSESEFATLQSKHQQQQSAGIPVPEQHLYCQPCGKLFANNNQWQNHLKSNKHIETARGSESAADTAVLVQKAVSKQQPGDENDEDDDGEEWESVSEDDSDDDVIDAAHVLCCLFCDVVSPDLTKCLEHMSVAHSFFLPDAEFVTDVHQLLLYLNEKVRKGHICLWCNDQGKSFDSTRSVQQHMMQKGHCKLRLEPGDDMIEFSDFYDYSSSYPDDDKNDGHEDEAEVTDNAVEVNADMELILPSGATVGHRSLKLYYKQNLPEKERPKPVSSNSRTVNGRQLMSQYQSLGYRSTTSLALAAKARDQQFIQKRMMKLGLKNNKLQRHFRSQIDF